MSKPLTPTGCDIADFPRMMLDIRRLRGSSFDATLNDSAWRAGLNLWMTAWHQVPAASLEDNEAELTKAAGLGRDVKTWRKLKAEALHGWVKCDDGRLYHETLAEMALEAWMDKLGQRLSSGAGNAKRHGSQFNAAIVYDDIKDAAEALTTLNPRSRSLSKQHVQKAMKGIPPEVPPGAENIPPGHPLRSQENRMERRVGEGSKKPSPTRQREVDFLGPKEVRDAFLEKLGEDWCVSYLDKCAWQDVPERALIPATRTAGTKLAREARDVLAKLGLKVLEKAA